MAQVLINSVSKFLRMRVRSAFSMRMRWLFLLSLVCEQSRGFVVPATTIKTTTPTTTRSIAPRKENVLRASTPPLTSLDVRTPKKERNWKTLAAVAAVGVTGGVAVVTIPMFTAVKTVELLTAIGAVGGPASALYAVSVSQQASTDRARVDAALLDFQIEQEISKSEIVFKKRVDTAVARLCETFAYDDGTLQEVSRIRDSDAATEVKDKAETYWTQGIIVPPEPKMMITSTAPDRFNPQVIEGLSGTGKSTALLRFAHNCGRRGVLYVSCKGTNSTEKLSIWAAVAAALNLPCEKDLNVGAVLDAALEKYRKDFPNCPLPIIIVDDLHLAFAANSQTAKNFLTNCGGFYDRGLGNFVFLGSDPIYDQITRGSARITGAAARFQQTAFVERDPNEIAEPFANFLSIIFARNKSNGKDSISPDALLPLAEDALLLLGPRYSDLLMLHSATSPDDLKRVVVDLIRKETNATSRNVGPGSICRALVESDDGMFIDKVFKYDGDEPLKCKDRNGNDSDLVTENLVRKDVTVVGGSSRPRYRPHHGAAFVAMAYDVRKNVQWYGPKLGGRAKEVLKVYDRFVEDVKDLKE